MTEQRSAFDPQFAPILKPGQNVRLWPDKAYYQVRFVEPIQPIGVDFTTQNFANGDIAAGAQEGPFEVPELECGQMFLGQYYIIPANAMEVQVLQPRAIGRFGTRTKQPDMSVAKPHVPGSREVFVHTTNRNIFISVTNLNGNDAMSVATVYFVGYKYHLETLTSAPAVYATVPIAGLQPRDT